jgi:hypothetical protein
LRWLAQIVRQIIRAVNWESEFKCEGVASLADFSALMSELEALDPVTVAVRPGNRHPDGWVPQQLQPPPTLFDSQTSWTAYWICWVRPPMHWRLRGINVQRLRTISKPGTISGRRFIDDSDRYRQV